MLIDPRCDRVLGAMVAIASSLAVSCTSVAIFGLNVQLTYHRRESQMTLQNLSAVRSIDVFRLVRLVIIPNRPCQPPSIHFFLAPPVAALVSGSQVRKLDDEDLEHLSWLVYTGTK